jgi:hypothetical protein
MSKQKFARINIKGMEKPLFATMEDIESISNFHDCLHFKSIVNNQDIIVPKAEIRFILIEDATENE